MIDIDAGSLLCRSGLHREAVPRGLTQCEQPCSTFPSPILSVLPHLEPALLGEQAKCTQEETGVFLCFWNQSKAPNFLKTDTLLMCVPAQEDTLSTRQNPARIIFYLWTRWFPEALQCHKGPLVP